MSAVAPAFLPEALHIDVPEIDNQHAALFARLANLKALCIAANALPVVEAEALMLALREHCATEERLATAAGLDFSLHAVKHGKMLKSIAKTLADVQAGKMDVFSLIRFVEYWFERHISEEDKSLGRHLQQAQAAQQ